VETDSFAANKKKQTRQQIME